MFLISVANLEVWLKLSSWVQYAPSKHAEYAHSKAQKCRNTMQSWFYHKHKTVSISLWHSFKLINDISPKATPRKSICKDNSAIMLCFYIFCCNFLVCPNIFFADIINSIYQIFSWCNTCLRVAFNLLCINQAMHLWFNTTLLQVQSFRLCLHGLVIYKMMNRIFIVPVFDYLKCWKLLS